MVYEKCRDGEDFVALGCLGKSRMMESSSSFWLWELALNGGRNVCMQVKAIKKLFLPCQRLPMLLLEFGGAAKHGGVRAGFEDFNMIGTACSGVRQ